MTTAEDPHEALMWDKDLRVTSEELKAYASSYPPMGVYIPRGRVKVPKLKSRRITSNHQCAKGKRNSPNLLMIKPNCQISRRLPSISVYGGRDVMPRDISRNVTHQVPSTSSRYVIEHRANESKSFKARTKEIDPMMSQFMYSNNDVMKNKMSEYAKTLAPTPVHLPNPMLNAALPPPYNETLSDKKRHYMPCKMTSRNDMTSLLPQEMPYPLGHHYYQHLSAIAAMAWSDCNQATEKLRRIYEETASLSRTYDPFGILSGGIPGYHAQILSSSPALGSAASIFGNNDSALPHNDYLAARYHQLAEDHKKYFNHSTTMKSQGGNSVPMNPPYPDMKIENCIKQERLSMTSRINDQFGPPKEALAGEALFDANFKSQQLYPYNVPDVKNVVSRHKRKRAEQTSSMTLVDTNCKIPRMELALHPNYLKSSEKPSITSQSYNNLKSFFPDGVFPSSNSQPPPYESIVGPLNQFGQDLLNGNPEYSQMKNNLCDVIGNNDVTEAAAAFAENFNFCLPSVSCSPTQSQLNDMQRNVPFVLQ